MTTESIFLLVGGVFGVVLGATATFNQEFAVRYVRTSPKAWLWRKMLGEERATRAVQRVFGPLGIAFGLALIVIALRVMRRGA